MLDKCGLSFCKVRGDREDNGGDGGGDFEGLLLYFIGVISAPLLSFDGPMQTTDEAAVSSQEFDRDLYKIMRLGTDQE